MGTEKKPETNPVEHPHTGMSSWKNQHGITVLRLHYSADDEKGQGEQTYVSEINKSLSPWALQAFHRMTDPTLYLKEYEIDAESSLGALLFNFDEKLSVERVREIPPEWTRRMAMDPHPGIPHAMLWMATDPWGDRWCVTPNTMILTADLRHIPAGDLKVGDELMGFDESAHSHNHRYWRRSKVEQLAMIRKPSLRIILEDGTTVTCSSDHQWLVSGSGGKTNYWRSADSLKRGQRLQRLTEVWANEESRDAGYLAASFDGEGSYSPNHGHAPTLSFNQKENIMLAAVADSLTQRRFRYGHYGRESEVQTLTLTRKEEILRFLGSIRPMRLLPKFDPDKLMSCQAFAHPAIVAVEEVGEQWVVAMQTSTRTFVAEGLASHNCYRELWPSKVCYQWHQGILHGRDGPCPQDEKGPNIREYIRTLKYLESGENPENRYKGEVFEEDLYARVIDYAARAFGKGVNDDPEQENYQQRYEKGMIEFELSRPFFDDAKKDRQSGVECVNEGFRKIERMGNDGDYHPTSRIHIIGERCPELIHQLKTNRRQLLSPVQVLRQDPTGKPVKVRNHMTDCLRYLEMSNPMYIAKELTQQRDTFQPLAQGFSY